MGCSRVRPEETPLVWHRFGGSRVTKFDVVASGNQFNGNPANWLSGPTGTNAFHACLSQPVTGFSTEQNPCMISHFSQFSENVVFATLEDVKPLNLNNVMEVLHKAKNLEITLDPAKKVMYCNWIGYQNKETVMSSGSIILDLLKKQGVSKVINDNTQVTGTWQDASEWTAKEWFPAMVGAGLKHFAWIFSPNIFAELSAKKAMPASDVVKSFGTFKDASDWINAQ